MSQQQMVRITSLARFLDSVENASTELLKTKYLYKSEVETQAFQDGIEVALKIIRREYGIEIKEGK